MSNLDDIKKEFEAKLKELISIDPSLAKDCMKFYARVKKHGDPNIKLQGGRTKVSASHKKETYRKYYEKKKAEREAEKERPCPPLKIASWRYCRSASTLPSARLDRSAGSRSAPASRAPS